MYLSYAKSSCDYQMLSASRPSTRTWVTTRGDWLHTADCSLLSVSSLENFNTKNCLWASPQHLMSIRHVRSWYLTTSTSSWYSLTMCWSFLRRQGPPWALTNCVRAVDPLRCDTKWEKSITFYDRRLTALGLPCPRKGSSLKRERYKPSRRSPSWEIERNNVDSSAWLITIAI